MPRLVESYCRLPAGERGKDPETDGYLTEGLTAIAAELGDLSKRRFIALRFPCSSMGEAR